MAIKSMTVSDLRSLRMRRAALLAAISTLWWGNGFAGVDFEPTVSVGIAHSDNVTLSSEIPEPETVYELIPAFNLTETGPRSMASAAYRLQGFYYRNRRDSSVYNTFDGRFSTAVDPKNFFIDLGASRNQTIRDPDAPIPRSNLSISDNRVNRDDYFAGPRLQYPFGQNATASASYRHNWVRFDDTSSLSTEVVVPRYEEDSTNFSLDNYRKERGFSWATRYNSDRTDYAEFGQWEYRQASLELGRWIGSGFRLFATGGKESAWDDPADPSLADGFWEAGFQTQAGRNLNAELAVGHRTFGDSRRVSFSWTQPHGQAQLSYAEQPTTTGRNPSVGLLLENQLPDLLSPAGAVERYISKRLQWTMGFELRRTTLSLSAFHDNRDDRTRIDGTPLPDEEQQSVSVSMTWRAGVRTDFVFSVNRSTSQLSSADTRKLDSASIGADYRLGSRTQLRFSYEHMREEVEGNASSLLNYSAGIVSLLLVRDF